MSTLKRPLCVEHRPNFGVLMRMDCLPEAKIERSMPGNVHAPPVIPAVLRCTAALPRLELRPSTQILSVRTFGPQRMRGWGAGSETKQHHPLLEAQRLHISKITDHRYQRKSSD